ncbi:hypothetical protein BJ742DRAFT_868268 [Cladochytrium replicatum]|nr:hypothetical protein BJ742DRAFT_868268 [Cladochytrium replicatum]
MVSIMCTPSFPPQKMSPSCAYTTMITAENYIVAVQVSNSLDQNTLVVLTPQPSTLQKSGMHSMMPPDLPTLSRDSLQTSDLNVDYAFSRLKETWNKIRVWDAPADTGFDRFALLDADMLILRNPDEVFSLLDPFPAPADVLSATIRTILSGGSLRTVRTRVGTFQRIIKHLVDNAHRLTDFKFPDQDLLNGVYSGNGASNPWIEVPCVEDGVHIIHFILDKPWNADLKSEKAKEDKFCGGMFMTGVLRLTTEIKFVIDDILCGKQLNNLIEQVVA